MECTELCISESKGLNIQAEFMLDEDAIGDDSFIGRYFIFKKIIWNSNLIRAYTNPTRSTPS